MGFDKGLHRLASELSSSTFLTSGGRSVSYPSSHVERRALKRKEWTPLLYARMAEDFRRKAAMISPDSSSHRSSIIDAIGEDYDRSPRTVEKAIASATLSSAAAK